ncbi:MAG: DUF4417 domain-containing protein [Bacillota bacterium]|nr:DUF4417 domain-containing protein [Bacillota bacterium]
MVITISWQLKLFVRCQLCDICSERGNCGGCNPDCKEGVFCHISKKCSKCGVLCSVRPNLSSFLAEIQGTDFPSLPVTRIPILNQLPAVIPLLTDRWDAERPYGLQWVAIGIGLIFRKSGINFDALSDLPSFLRIPKSTKILLVNHGEDSFLENYWRFSKVRGYAQAIKKSGIVLATGLNFSLFDEHPRLTHLVSMKKSLITTKELIEAGVPAIPHMYWKNQADLDRWVDFLNRNPHVNAVSVNFTYRRANDVFASGIKDLQWIRGKINRQITCFVIGVSSPHRVAWVCRELKPSIIIAGKIQRAACARRLLDGEHDPSRSRYETFMDNLNGLLDACG